MIDFYVEVWKVALWEVKKESMNYDKSLKTEFFQQL